MFYGRNNNRNFISGLFAVIFLLSYCIRWNTFNKTKKINKMIKSEFEKYIESKNTFLKVKL
jgi:hypothetical protein